MKASIGNIFVSEPNYEYVRQVYIKNRAKNFSQTLNEILDHSRNLIEQHQRTVERIQELLKENNDLKQTIENYRTQVIKSG